MIKIILWANQDNIPIIYPRGHPDLTLYREWGGSSNSVTVTGWDVCGVILGSFVLWNLNECSWLYSSLTCFISAFTGKVISINETGRPDNPYVTARVQVTRLIKEDESRSLSLKVMQFYGGNRRCPTRGTYACYREGGEFGFFGHDNMVQGLTISFSLTLPDEQFLLDIVETLWRTKYKVTPEVQFSLKDPFSIMVRFDLIGRCDYFGLGLKTFNCKAV